MIEVPLRGMAGLPASKKVGIRKLPTFSVFLRPQKKTTNYELMLCFSENLFNFAAKS